MNSIWKAVNLTPMRTKKPKGKHYRGYLRPHRLENATGYNFLYFPRYGNNMLWAYQSKDGTIKERGYFDKDGKPVTYFTNRPLVSQSTVCETGEISTNPPSEMKQ